MGLPKLLILKQCLTKPSCQFTKTFSKQSLNPLFNFTRALSSAPVNSPILSEIINFVANSPNASVVPLLEQHFEKDNGVLRDELPRIIRKLRKLKRFDRALEVSEWTDNKSLRRTDSGDLAVHLDIIGKINGVDAAEKFFIGANEHSERVYGSMLNCYVQAKLVDKSLSHFNKMKEMGIVASPLTYNSIMSLYLKTGQGEKVRDLMLEMQDNGVSPDDVSYRMCLKSCGQSSDFDSVDKLLTDMENRANQHQLKLDWFTYSTVANYYIDGGHSEKAMNCLQKAEVLVHENAVGYNNLISTYAKLGLWTEVTRLWQKQKDVCKTQNNADYMVILSALVKLDKFQHAELLLEEWELSGNMYDSRVPDVLLMRYAQNEQVEKAERMLEAMITKNKTAAPSSWGIISEGYVKRLNMPKAVQCMEKSLRLGPQHKGWVPKRAVISSILNWLGGHGEIEQVYEFLKLMSRVVPMNKNMYQAFVQASKRHGKDIDDVLQRLKGDNIDIDEETRKLMELRV